METKNSADVMASKDTPAINALCKSLETDRRQLTELTERIARQEAAELAALLSARRVCRRHAAPAVLLCSERQPNEEAKA